MTAPVDRLTLENLLAMFNGDKAFVYQVLDTYLADGLRLLDTLQKSLAAGSAVDLQRAAHSLKSNSANVGALTLSSLSRELEELSRQGNLNDAPALLAQLTSEFQLVQAELQKIRTEGL